MSKIGGIRELSEATDDESCAKSVLAALKAQHKHSDGTPVELHLIKGDSGIEKNLQEEMNRFKQLQQEQKTAEITESTTVKQQPRQQINENEAIPETKRTPLVMAGCNCGQTLVATREEATGIKVSTYDVSGKVIETSYENISGSEEQGYSISSSGKEEYKG